MENIRKFPKAFSDQVTTRLTTMLKIVDARTAFRGTFQPGRT